LTGSSTSGSVADCDFSATVRVWTHNYAGLRPETLWQAQREASRIFGRIAVLIEWVVVRKSETERELFANCRHDVNHTPGDDAAFFGWPPAAPRSSRTAF
jgi:hypothetical protein